MPSRPIGNLSNAERRSLHGAYTEGPAAYGSIANLVKQTGLSRKKVKQFLHSNNAYTKYHIAKRKFPRLKVFARHVNDIWCVDLAQVDKLASNNNGVKYLLVAIDVLSRFVRVQPMKDKQAKSTKQAFMKMIRSVQPKKLWTDQGTEFGGEFKTYCKTLGITLYHTFSDTKAAYAERAIRSLKNIMYRSMEERNTFKYTNQLQKFAQTMNSRINRSIGMAPKDVKNSDALALIYAQKPAKYTKPKYKINDYVRISKKDIPFRKGYKPQFTNEIFQIAQIATTKPPTYILRDKDNETIKGKFYEQELILYTV